MQPSCISWEDVSSPSYWTTSKQLRASYLHLYLGLCAPIPGVRDETSGARDPACPGAAARRAGTGGCSGWGGRIQLAPAQPLGPQ